MIDPNFPLASWFLLASAGIYLIGYALPMLMAPLEWAEWFNWKLPTETELVTYLGRSLGAIFFAFALVCLWAAPDPWGNLQIFQLVIVVGTALTVVHVWGAVKKRQPAVESWEIVFLVLWTGLAVYFWRVLATQ